MNPWVTHLRNGPSDDALEEQTMKVLNSGGVMFSAVTVVKAILVVFSLPLRCVGLESRDVRLILFDVLRLDF